MIEVQDNSSHLTDCVGPSPLCAAAAGLLAVRGAEVVEVRDEEGGLMNDFTGRVRLEDRKPPKGECCVCGNQCEYVGRSRVQLNQASRCVKQGGLGLFRRRLRFLRILRSWRRRIHCCTPRLGTHAAGLHKV